MAISFTQGTKQSQDVRGPMSDIALRAGMTERTVEEIRDVLAGRTRRFRPLLFAGPAVVASIAYWIPAISRPTSRPAPNTAMACCGSYCSPISSPCCFRPCRPSSASSPGETSRSCAASIFPAGRAGNVGRQRDRGDGHRSRRVPGGAIGLSLLCHMPLLPGMSSPAPSSTPSCFSSVTASAPSNSSSALSSLRSRSATASNCSSRRSTGGRGAPHR